MHLPPWPPLAEATAWLIEETGRRWTPDDVIRALLATSGHLELSLVIPRETALSIFNGLEYVDAGCLADPCPMGVHGAKQFLLDLQSSDVAVPLALNSAGGRYRTAVSFGLDDISLSRQSVYALRNEHESLRPNDPKVSASSSLQGDELPTAPTPEPSAGVESQIAPEDAHRDELGVSTDGLVAWQRALLECWPRIMEAYTSTPSPRDAMRWMKKHGPRDVIPEHQPYLESMQWFAAASDGAEHTVTLKTMRNVISAWKTAGKRPA